MKKDVLIFTENVEPEAVNQIYTLAAAAPFENQKIRIMPDVHVGTGCVVGFTSTLSDKIIPNVLGVDLGCGMLCVELGKVDFSLADLDCFIRAKIPHGSGYRKENNAENLIKKLNCFNLLKDFPRLYGSLGTLGGGNHFIEVDEDEDKNRYLIIHSGSRNIGLQVAKIYQKMAIEDCKFCAEEEKKEKIAELNKLGKPEDIPGAIAKITAKYAHKTKICAELCYLEGENMQDYLHDLKICQEFAALNRKKMAEDILKFLKIYKYSCFETVHNFIDIDNVIRKGAIPARKGQKVLIPMNMRDGCVIAEGLGNAEWNNSAPHGAGRILKRSEVKQLFSIDEYKEQMRGIYSSTVSESTIDESPMAYKPCEEILKLISPTVKILKVIKPVYNFKSAE
ncbi:MAG: RtcB family protein [Clostridia bacterium]|nr:RtcB family protein [Clostridia bacterium]